MIRPREGRVADATLADAAHRVRRHESDERPAEGEPRRLPGEGRMDDYEQRYMAPDERVVFREKIVSRRAFAVAKVFLAVWGSLGLALVAAAAAGAMPLAIGLGAGLPALLLGITMAVLGAMFSVFRSMVTTSHLHVHFGWVKRRVPFSAIEGVRPVALVGFRQGKVSLGVDGVVRTWVGQSSSGRGVEVTYHEPGSRKHVLTIGSDDAEGYVAAIERGRAGAGKTIATRVGDAVSGEADEGAAEAEALEDAVSGEELEGAERRG